MQNFEEKLVDLIVEWKRCLEYEGSQAIASKMGVHLGILNEIPEQLSPETRHKILELIDQKYSSAYNAAKKVVAQGI